MPLNPHIPVCAHKFEPHEEGWERCVKCGGLRELVNGHGTS